MTKICTKCKLPKGLEDFSPHPTGRLGRAPRCRKCLAAIQAEFKARNPLKARHYRIYSEYGLTVEQFAEKNKAQGGKCWICGTAPEPGQLLCIDHDHVSGAIRGLLCQKCNSGLGFFQDDEARLHNAVRYLREFS